MTVWLPGSRLTRVQSMCLLHPCFNEKVGSGKLVFQIQQFIRGKVGSLGLAHSKIVGICEALNRPEISDQCIRHSSDST